jgi:hypothetical protein
MCDYYYYFKNITTDDSYKICKEILHLDSNERNTLFKSWCDQNIWFLIYISAGLHGVKIKKNGLKIFRKFILHLSNDRYIYNIFSYQILNKLYNLLLSFDPNDKSDIEIIEFIDYSLYKIQKEEEFIDYIHNNPIMIQFIQNLIQK